MDSIIKTNIISHSNLTYINYIIKDYVIKNNYLGFIMIDANNKIITNDKKRYIQQIFNSSYVFISAQSFQQNNFMLSNQIRKYVSSLVTNYKNMTCIGGESYLYGITCNIPIIYFYTNSNSIYSDCQFNEHFYKSNIIIDLCDYNNIKVINSSQICLINLSNLNNNLMNVINKNSYEYIIIISCHHEDFWKKTKLLSSYKLKLRKKFISYNLKYFITVNIFKLKNLI